LIDGKIIAGNATLNVATPATETLAGG
jgi:hypothetical protein